VRNEIRKKKDQQIKMFNAKVALPQATSFVTADFYQGKYTLRS